MKRLLAVVLLAAACASTPQNPYRPTVVLEQLNTMSFGATTNAPVGIEVHVRNKGAVPLLVKKVRIEGGLSQQYIVNPVEQNVTVEVPPGESRGVRLTIMAISQQGRINDPEPLNLRGFVTYLAEGKQYQDFYVFRSIMQ